MLLFVVCSLAPAAQAQDDRLLPVEHWAYDYLTRLQRRGHLLELNPLAPPYRHGAVWNALDRLDPATLSRAERHWVRMLSVALAPAEAEPEEAVVGYWFEGGARVINSDRLDVVRPLADTLNLFWYLYTINLYADFGPFVVEAGAKQDAYFDDDPDGLDTALRLLSRSENTYAGVHTRYFSGYLGRWSTHWGVPGEAATLVSSNPRSQDQLVFRVGGQRLAVTGLLSELDSVTEDGRYTGRAGEDPAGSRRRYLAAHRWDFRPSPHVVLTFMESVLYSGRNAGVSLKYANPLQPFIFAVDNRPKNDENNGFFAGMLWAQHRRLTLHGQLAIDDFDFLGRSGNETLTFSLVGSLHYAAPGFELGTRLEVITPTAYNAPQPEGKYIFLLRGLATQFSDYVHATAYADVYLDGLAPGLQLTPRLHLLAQGERDMRQPNPDPNAEVAFLLDGTAERTVRAALQVRYQPVPWGWLRLDGGVNFVSDENHVAGATASRFVGLAEVGIRYTVGTPLRLDIFGGK